jgi:hypothetical protein
MVPFSSNVNYGYTTIGPAAPASPLFKLGILDGTANATVSGTLDTTTGAISAGHLSFPAKTFPGAALNPALGAASTITVGLAENPANSLTGQAGPSAGQVSFTGKYTIAVTLAHNAINPSLDGTCNYDLTDQTTPANPMVVSTETTSAPSGYPGQRFNNPDTTGPGSVAGNGHTATTGAPNAGTCGVFNANLDNKAADLWLGHNSLPTTPVPYSQVINFSQLNVGAATGLSIVGSTPAVYYGVITGDPAMAGVTQATATTSIDPAAVWSGTRMQGFDLTPSPGSFAGHTVSVDLAVKSGTTLKGTFDPTNGHETLGESGFDQYTTTVVVDGALTCTSDPDPLDLSTDKTTVTDPFGPRDGVRFAGLGGNGAMMDSWPSLPAFTPSPACDQLSGLTVGLPGGLWLSHGINPAAGGGGGPDTTTTVPAPPPATGGTTKKKKCKKKKSKSAQSAKKKCKKKK